MIYCRVELSGRVRPRPTSTMFHPCRQHALDARRGKVARAEPKELRERRRERQQSCGMGREAQSITKLWNANGNALEGKGRGADVGQSSPSPIDGWRGFDGDRGCMVFLPHRDKPLTRLECIAAGVRYPAIDRGVYRVIA